MWQEHLFRDAGERRGKRERKRGGRLIAPHFREFAVTATSVFALSARGQLQDGRAALYEAPFLAGWPSAYLESVTDPSPAILDTTVATPPTRRAAKPAGM